MDEPLELAVDDLHRQLLLPHLTLTELKRLLLVVFLLRQLSDRGVSNSNGS